MYDVEWFTTHPTLFGTVDGTGQFDLWNLNADTEELFVSTQVGSSKVLNNLAWDKEGKEIAIGSSDGQVYVYVYDIGEARRKINVNQKLRFLIYILFQNGNS